MAPFLDTLAGLPDRLNRRSLLASAGATALASCCGCGPQPAARDESASPTASIAADSENQWIQDCEADRERLAPLEPCMRNYGIGTVLEEWPYNLISRRAMAWSCGAISRRGENILHRHGHAEFALCRRLAREAAETMRDTQVEFGSDDRQYFSPFYIVANQHEAAPPAITDVWVRHKFGGTIYPPARIWIEPLSAAAGWWRQVAAGLQRSPHPQAARDLAAWRSLLDWFARRDELHAASFVMIGDTPLDPDMKNLGFVFPRLAVALTGQGSLVGLCGNVVHE